MASMLLSVASSMQRRMEGRQPSEPIHSGEIIPAASRSPVPVLGASSQRTPQQNGKMTLASPAAVSNRLKDLLTMQEDEQQSLWSLDAALQACIAV